MKCLKNTPSKKNEYKHSSDLDKCFPHIAHKKTDNKSKLYSFKSKKGTWLVWVNIINTRSIGHRDDRHDQGDLPGPVSESLRLWMPLRAPEIIRIISTLDDGDAWPSLTGHRGEDYYIITCGHRSEYRCSNGLSAFTTIWINKPLNT